jgi:hypothetical protein
MTETVHMTITEATHITVTEAVPVTEVQQLTVTLPPMTETVHVSKQHFDYATSTDNR